MQSSINPTPANSDRLILWASTLALLALGLLEWLQ